MHKLSSNSVIGLVAASMLAIGALASPALAQADADKIRAQCLDEVGKAYPDISSTDHIHYSITYDATLHLICREWRTANILNEYDI
jgi:hypothetical protein